MGGALGAGIQQLRDAGVSENIATQSAMNAININDKLSSSKGLDIFNVMEYAQLGKDFGGANWNQKQRLAGTSVSQARALKDLYSSGKTSEAEELSVSLGLYGVVKDTESADKLFDTASSQALRSQLGFGADVKSEKRLIDLQKKGISWDKLNKEDQSFLQARAKMTSGESADARAIWANSVGQEAKQGSLKGPTGTAASGENMNVSAAWGDADQFNTASKKVGGIGGLSDRIEGARNETNTQKASDLTKDSADKLTMMTDQFSSTMTKFDGSVTIFSKATDALIKTMEQGSDLTGKAAQELAKSISELVKKELSGALMGPSFRK